MHFSDEIYIKAPREKVWDFLLDPEKVGACGPGVESVEVTDDRRFKAVVKVGIGQFRSRFTVDLELADLTPPTRATIRAHGDAPGTAVDATAHMTLHDEDEGATRMKWAAEVALSGKLAAVGGRLIEWTANKLIGQTFDCIKTRLES